MPDLSPPGRLPMNRAHRRGGQGGFGYLPWYHRTALHFPRTEEAGVQISSPPPQKTLVPGFAGLAGQVPDLKACFLTREATLPACWSSSWDRVSLRPLWTADWALWTQIGVSHVWFRVGPRQVRWAVDGGVLSTKSTTACRASTRSGAPYMSGEMASSPTDRP